MSRVLRTTPYIHNTIRHKRTLTISNSSKNKSRFSSNLDNDFKYKNNSNLYMYSNSYSTDQNIQYKQQELMNQFFQQQQQQQKQQQKLKTKHVLIPRNSNQELYINTLNNINPSIVVATGPAGSAKSYIAVAVGIDKLVNKEYKRLVITRPAVSVDEEMGFLPGSITEKMDPWMRPLYDTFYKYYSVAEVKTMIANKIIDICPIAYLRGRTLEDSYIIIDEAQNCTINQMLMILTRIGSGSKMVITGDLTQHDRGFTINGLGDFIQRLNNNEINNFNNIIDIARIHFTEEDIERHPVIKDIMKLYNRNSV